MYTISTFSMGELNESVTHRKPKSHLIEISSDMDWIDVKAQLKIAICDLHFLQQVVVDDDCYNMTWCIPHVVTDILSLHTAPHEEGIEMQGAWCKDFG